MYSPSFDADKMESSLTLDKFEALLKKWTSTINLVSPQDAIDPFGRHVADCMRLADDPSLRGQWLDLGSGAGFPGVVVAILASERVAMTLVEADARKCAFLHAARRELGLRYEVVNGRIEQIAPFAADVISSRALAPLDTLLAYHHRHAHQSTVSLFMKGVSWRREVEEAQRRWVFDWDADRDGEGEGSAIVKVSNVRPR